MAPDQGAPLGGVLTEIGSTLLEVVVGRVIASARVSSTAIYDAYDPSLIEEGALVLGVGVVGEEALGDLIRALVERRAAALILREPVAIDGVAAAEAERAGIAILGLVRGVPWNQLATTASAAIARYADKGTPRTAIQPLAEAGDLTGLANAISTLLDAPITIEDINSTILAYSSDQDRADKSRQDSILGQRVPESYLSVLRDAGVFRRIYAGPHPIYLDKETAYEYPRAAVRVTAGDELVGSIWAVVHKPLTEDQERVFMEAARVVAVHILRSRGEMDNDRRERRHLLSALLSGGDAARIASTSLGLGATGLAVCAVRSVDSAGHGPADSVRLAKIAGALQLHLSTTHTGSVAGVVGEVAYGILPLDAHHESPSKYLSEVSRDFVRRSGSRSPVLIAFGPVVTDPADLSVSRRDADRALRVIGSPSTSRGRTAVRADEVQADVMILDVHDRWVAEQRSPSGAVFELDSYDKSHDTDLVDTLEAYFDEVGDIRRASERLVVHPNTCRHRLRRIHELTGLDLDDGEQRFGAMLQLRLLRLQ